MYIKKIHVANFKSFDDVEFKLGRFNVAIGANSSGKSNFISIFQFLSDIAIHGMDDAVSLQGGCDYLMNMKIGAETNLLLECSLDTIEEEKRVPVTTPYQFYKDKEGKISSLSEFHHNYEYSLEIRFNKTTPGYRIVEEKISASSSLDKAKGISRKERIRDFIKGTFEINREGTQYTESFTPDDSIPTEFENYLLMYKTEEKIDRKESIVTNSERARTFRRLLQRMGFYDFDPKKCKGASKITDIVRLRPDGSNLSIVLRRLLSNKVARKRLTRIVQDLLPFVKDMSIEKSRDKSLIASLTESYLAKSLPADIMSDGTANVIALVVALFFESDPTVVIEEPERNIHPYLISRVVDLMKSASEGRLNQLVVTTHNPEVVKHSGLENLILLMRNKHGFSKIERPLENERTKIFLKNEIGLDELYISNLLG